MTTEHAVSGASAEEILDLCREYTLYEWGTQEQINPIPFVRAKGIYLWDADGKRYLDFNSQAMCVNIGHADDRVVRAIAEQVAELPYVVPAHATEARGRLGKELARISPEGLNKSYITLAGADANEAAVRIARLYTGRHKILTRYRSYHGSSQGVMYASGDFRRMPSEEGMTGVVRILDPYLYRSPLAVNEEDFVPGLHAVPGGRDPAGGAGDDRGDPTGADHRHERDHCPAGGLVPGRARALRPLRHFADRR